MRIAVIGTGRMGTALGNQLVLAGHEVRVGSRDPERGRRFAALMHASFGGGYQEAAAGAPAVVLAVPWAAVWDTIVRLGELEGVIVIDVMNPFREGSDSEQQEFPGSSAAEQLQALLPRASVVKAWNTTYSGVVHRSPDFDGVVASVFVASDDPEAKEAVASLVRDVGYEPVDTGPLSSARYLEPLAGLMTALDRLSGGEVEHAFKLLTRKRAPRPAAAQEERTIAEPTT